MNKMTKLVIFLSLILFVSFFPLMGNQSQNTPLLRWELEWVKYENSYSEGELYRGYDLTLAEAQGIAEADKNVTGILFVHDDVYGKEGFDYASDTVLLYPKNSVIFLGDTVKFWFRNSNVTAYIKRNKLVLPENYSYYIYADYLRGHEEMMVKKAVYSRATGLSLEDAFRIAENDPSITHFIQMPDALIKQVIVTKDEDYTGIYYGNNLEKYYFEWAAGEFIFFDGYFPEWLSRKTILTPKTPLYIKEK